MRPASLPPVYPEPYSAKLMTIMLARVAVCFAFSLVAAAGADWNSRLAAQYLDSRQKELFAWPRANGGARPCISCRTGLTYLLARPVRREALVDTGATVYEIGQLAASRSR